MSQYALGLRDHDWAESMMEWVWENGYGRNVRGDVHSREWVALHEHDDFMKVVSEVFAEMAEEENRRARERQGRE